MHEEHTTLIFFKKYKITTLVSSFVFLIFILVITAIYLNDPKNFETFLGTLIIFSVLFLTFFSLSIYYSKTYKKMVNCDITSTNIYVRKIIPKINRIKNGSFDFRGISLLTDNGTYHFYVYKKYTMTIKKYKEIKPYFDYKEFHCYVDVFDKTKIIYKANDTPLSEIIDKIINI